MGIINSAGAAAVLALGMTLATSAGAQAADIAVTLAMDAEVDATLFAMVGRKIVWRSGDLGDVVAVPHTVPTEVKGTRIDAICVRLGEGWRVSNGKGKTFQASCFGVDQAMIDRGSVVYEMAAERGKPGVPMPDGM